MIASSFTSQSNFTSSPNTHSLITSQSTPTKKQFIDYLESYAKKFDINPQFNECVQSAKYNEACGLWRVKTVSISGSEVEYICQWLVVATGENAECVMPEIEGLKEFSVEVLQACEYKSDEKVTEKRVLVVEIPAWKSLLISATTMPNHPWLFEARTCFPASSYLAD
ncbi:unnamed protein product [Camellia sinensis]